jgi:HNH endonuclease/AP2 domain
MKPYKNKESLLTSEYLREQLSYNSDTGEFRWLVANSHRVKIGDVAGSLKFTGYRYICLTFNSKQYLFRAHRLAWLYVYGSWPSNNLDHIDRNRLNNCISNLREATYSENNKNQTKQANRSSRYVGVWWNKPNQKWNAGIGANGKYAYLGSFTSEEEAALAYNAAALARDPNFNNLNVLP